MSLAFDGFDWDAGNEEKCRKHGLSAAEIAAVLRGNPRIAPDIAHSSTEARFIAVGRAPNGRPVFIALTFRTRDGSRLIRPVSARYMHAKEARRHEAEGS